MRLRVEVDGHVHDVEIQRVGDRIRATSQGEVLETRVVGTAPTVRLEVGDRSHVVEFHDDVRAALDGAPVEYRVEDFAPGEPVSGGAADGKVAVRASMSGRLVRVLVKPGQEVRRGEPLFILESMKMQNELQSPAGGKVLDISANEGEVVEPGRLLGHLESAKPGA